MKKKKLIVFCAVLLSITGLLGATALAEGTVQDKIVAVNEAVNGVIWSAMLFAILGTGLLMTILSKAFQITHFRHWWKNSIGSVFSRKDVLHSDDDKSISQFQSLCTAISATVGTGNIVSVAAAIAAGGPGAIFWMWIAAILGLMTNFSENALGIYYRRRNSSGEWCGGAMYYLQDGLGRMKGMKQIGKILAVMFSVFTIIASFGIGNMGQINTISANVSSTMSAFGVKDFSVLGVSGIKLITGAVLMIVAGLVVMGGLKRIAATSELLVPVMAGTYIVGALVIVFHGYTRILPALGSIFRFAFTGKAVAGGTIGTVIKLGLKRGVFSNEAGLGSSVMIHSNSNSREPVAQGIWGIFEVFADTLVICTLTALVILTSDFINLETGCLINGGISSSSLTSACFGAVFGKAGIAFVTVSLILFAFSTTLGWFHYGTKSWEYLVGTKSIVIYRVIFVGTIMVSALMKSSLAWDISDTFNGLMALPNLIGVIACSGTVYKIIDNYNRRTFKGENIKPMLSYDPEIQAQMEAKIGEE